MMADLTVTAEASAVVPFASCFKMSGVKRQYLTGAGGDSTELRAAATGKRHVIVGGSVVIPGDSTLVIKSATTVIGAVGGATAGGTFAFPRGLETATAAALNLDKSEAAIAVSGYIDTVSIKDGETVPLLEAY